MPPTQAAKNKIMDILRDLIKPNIGYLKLPKTLKTKKLFPYDKIFKTRELLSYDEILDQIFGNINVADR